MGMKLTPQSGFLVTGEENLFGSQWIFPYGITFIHAATCITPEKLMLPWRWVMETGHWILKIYLCTDMSQVKTDKLVGYATSYSLVFLNNYLSVLIQREK